MKLLIKFYLVLYGLGNIRSHVKKHCFLANFCLIMAKCLGHYFHNHLIKSILLYCTKVSRDKTFAVRSPCEYLRKKFRICISIAQNDELKISKRLNILKFAEKH